MNVKIYETDMKGGWARVMGSQDVRLTRLLFPYVHSSYFWIFNNNKNGDEFKSPMENNQIMFETLVSRDK